MKAVEWVRNTFKKKLMRMEQVRDEEGHLLKEKVEVETNRILLEEPSVGGEVFITVENFAKAFKAEIESNDTDNKRLKAIKAKKVMRTIKHDDGSEEEITEEHPLVSCVTELEKELSN